MRSSMKAWSALALQDILWLTQTQPTINAFLPLILLSHTQRKILENYIILYIYFYVQYISVNITNMLLYRPILTESNTRTF